MVGIVGTMTAWLPLQIDWKSDTMFGRMHMVHLASVGDDVIYTQFYAAGDFLEREKGELVDMFTA